LLGKGLRESPHVGAEYLDDLGRAYDAVGGLNASKFWNEGKFINSIRKHLLKSNDFTVVDMKGLPLSKSQRFKSTWALSRLSNSRKL